MNKIKPGRSNREEEAVKVHMRLASSPALWASGLPVLGKNKEKLNFSQFGLGKTEFSPVLEAEWPLGYYRDMTHYKMLQT